MSLLASCRLLLLVFGLGAAATALPAQLTIFALFGDGNGDYAGSSNLAGRSKWVELTSCNFGVNAMVTFDNQGASVSTPSFSAFTLTKVVDRLTPVFFSRLVTKSPIPIASTDGANLTIEYAQISKAGETVLFRLEFKNVYFSGLNSSAQPGSPVAESVEVAFGAVRMTPFTNGTAGNPQSYNIVNNTLTF